MSKGVGSIGHENRGCEWGTDQGFITVISEKSTSFRDETYTAYSLLTY